MTAPRLALHTGATAASPTGIRSRWAFRVFAVVEVALLAAYWLPLDDRNRAFVFILSRVVTLVTMAWSALALPRPLRRYWLMLFAALVAWTATEFVVAGATVSHGTFAGWAVVGLAPIVGYVLMAAGVIGMVRREGLVEGAQVWLEGGVVVVSFLVAWWILAGHVAFGGEPSPLRDQSVSLFAFSDVLSIGTAVVLMSARSDSRLANRVLTAGCIVAVVSDLLFAAYANGTLTFPPDLIIWGWLWQHILIVAACLLAHRRTGIPDVRNVSMASVVVLVVAVAAPLTIFVSGTHWRHHGAGEWLTTIIVLAGTVVLVTLGGMRFNHIAQEVADQARELEQTARTDDLTGLPNRRAGRRLLSEAVAAARLGDGPLCVALIDLDHFKRFNDTHGHLRGDDLLREAARRWIAEITPPHTLYRHGGEEFVAILRGADADEAAALLERVRAVTPRGQTFSAGLATWHDDDDPHSLLSRADAALYSAKDAGRACTVAA